MQRLLFVSALAGLAGCLGHPDVIIDNPLSTGQLDGDTEIVKPDDHLEQFAAVPAGTLASHARIEKLDADQACFAVLLPTMDQPIDMKEMSFILKEPERGRVELDGAAVATARPKKNRYRGREYVEVAGPLETRCVEHTEGGGCSRWQSAPTVSHEFKDANIDIYRNQARACFVHNGLVSDRSQRVALEIVYPNGGKRVFRWGFPPPPKR
jgi:hypothetical protein